MSAADYNARALKKQPRVKNAKRKVLNGLEFDSTREARRYQDIAIMQTAGHVRELRRQVPYPIYVKGIFVCDWRADFVYEQKDGDRWIRIVEDSKGWKTDVYKLKKKLIEAEYGFRIKET